MSTLNRRDRQQDAPYAGEKVKNGGAECGDAAFFSGAEMQNANLRWRFG